MTRSKFSNNLKCWPLLLSLLLLGTTLSFARGENIDPDNDGSQYAWGENVGWLNLEPGGDGGAGVEVSDGFLSGFIWGENIGWINMSPYTGGVSNDGDGNLSGFAWGENIGWINFAPQGGGVSIDPCTGDFSGFAWGENVGWINFGPFEAFPGSAKTSWGKDSDIDGEIDCKDDCPYVVGDACDVPGYDSDQPPPPEDFTDGLGSWDHKTWVDPVNLVTGDYIYSRALLSVPAAGLPFTFSIHYNSGSSRTSPIGHRWSHSYHWYIESPGEDTIAVKRGDGRADYFLKAGDAYVPKYSGISSTLAGDGSGGFVYTSRERTKYLFGADGRLGEIRDRNGNSIVLEHSSGRLVRIVDPRGNTATLTYDAEGFLVKVDFAGLQTVSFEHDGSSNLTGVTLADVGTIRFTYDTSSRMLTGTGSDNVVFVTNEYDGEGRVVRQWDAKGALSTIAYQDNGQVNVTDRLGRIETRKYDILGRLIEWEDASGGVKSYTYDENSNITSYTDPNGDIFSTIYDDAGNPIEFVDPLGNVITEEYGDQDNPHLPTALTDAAGYITTFEYDDKGNLIRSVYPRGLETDFTFNLKGQILSIKAPNDGLTRFTYTPVGDLATVTDPLGAVTQYEYDELGRRTAVIDPRGNRIAFAYNDLGQITSIMTPDGAETRFTYDQTGRLLTIEQPDGAVTAYERNETGRITAETNPVGNIWGFEYNAEDHILRRIDPLGRISQFMRNDIDLPNAATEALGSAVEATATAGYDLSGNRLRMTDPNGSVTTLTFDALGRVLTETDPLGNIVTNAYDKRGLLASITNGRGITATFAYDGAGNLTETKFPDETTISHQLDALGNREQSVDREGNTIQRNFDLMGRLLSRTDVFGNTVGYKYDEAGNLVELTYSDGLQVRYEYDTQNRLVKVADWQGRVTAYEYDLVGRLKRADLPDGSVVNYGYDSAGRITAISDTAYDGSLVFSAAYLFNDAGLMIGETAQLPLTPATAYADLKFTMDSANQIASLNGCNGCFAYDADGNLVQGLIGGVMTDLDYDELGQLARIGQDSYRYDADGLRVEAKLGNAMRQYVVDPASQFSRVLEEHDANGQILARYVYGVGLISRVDAAGDARIYHYDHRGNTVALTDMSGIITDRYAYTPYGKLVGKEGGTPNPFTFDGRDGVMDDGNGLYFMRSRYYAPYLMRFIQRDNLYRGTIMFTQSLNRYAYAGGMPILAVDPGGAWWNPVSALIGAVAGAVVNVGVQFVADLISREFSDPWDYAIAAGSGAITGLLTGALGPGGYGLSSLKAGVWGGGAGGLFYSASIQAKEILQGEQKRFNVLDLGFSIVGGALGGGAGGIFAGMVSSNLTSLAIGIGAGFGQIYAMQAACGEMPDWIGCQDEARPPGSSIDSPDHLSTVAGNEK